MTEPAQTGFPVDAREGTAAGLGRKRRAVSLTVSLTKNAMFRQVYSRGQSAANRNLVLYVWKRSNGILAKKNEAVDASCNRVGVSVSRRVGKSVTRSLVKRLIKENYRLMETQVVTGYDMVFVARMAAGKLERKSAFKEIGRSMRYLLKKHNMLSEKDT